jgi:hypothetical protein
MTPRKSLERNPYQEKCTTLNTILTISMESHGILVERVRKFCRPPRNKVSSHKAGKKAITIKAMMYSPELFSPTMADTCSL